MDSEVKRGRKPKKEVDVIKPQTPKESISKITEVKTETQVAEFPEEEQEEIKRNPNEYLVFINGKERWLSKASIEVAKKDYKITLEIPENSPLVEPALPEPCKNCG